MNRLTERSLEFSERKAPVFPSGVGTGTVLKHSVILGGALVCLYLITWSNYLLFHSLSEIFSIVVAYGIFMVAWNTRRIHEDGFLLLIGIGYFFVSLLDLFHTLSYKGIGILPGDSSNHATQLWITARYVEAVTLFIAPFLMSRRLSAYSTFLAYAAVAALVLGAIFSWDVFPDCFLEEAGLTRFKITSEYIICGFLLASAGLLWRRSKSLPPETYWLLTASILLTVFAELAFTLYSDVFDVFNRIGHFLKIISFYLMYRAIVATGLVRPFSLLFRDLKQREKDLMRSERRYRQLFEGMISAFVLHDVIYDDDGRPCDFRIVKCNPSFERLMERSSEQLVGRTILELAPEGRPEWFDVCVDVALTGNPAGFEIYSRLLEKHLEVYAFVPEKGQIAATLMDITDRKEAEQALQKARQDLERKVRERTKDLLHSNEALQDEIQEREHAEEGLRKSEERFDLAVAGSTDGLWDLHDPARDAMWWSPRFFELLGFSKRELVPGVGVLKDLLHPEDRDRTMGFLDAHLKYRKPFDLEFRLRTKSGDYCWFRMRGQAIWDQHGKPLRMAGSLQYIHDRKTAEEMLRKQDRALEERVRELRCLYRISRLAETRNEPLHEVVQDMVNLIPLGFQDPKSIGARLTLEGEDFVTAEFDENGETASCDVNLQDGSIGKLVLSCRDGKSSDSGPLMEEKRSLLIAVAEQIGRTIEKCRAQEELHSYMAQLERSNKELQEFAFVASHDLQEPLRKIQTFSNLLQHKYTPDLGPVAKDYLERMQNAANRMQNLIRALLGFSRVTTRAQPFSQVDLAQLLEEIMDDLEIVIRQTGGEVDVGELPAIMADRDQMRQLFQNLVSNALKFQQNNHPRVKIYQLKAVPEIAAEAPEKAWHSIVVEDNGIGFDIRHLDRIFKPFQRLHGRYQYEGTGIGLAICKKIVERHGGRINAESTPGEGSKFVVTLPSW